MKTIIVSLLLMTSLQVLAQTGTHDSTKQRMPVKLYIIDGDPVCTRPTTQTISVCLQSAPLKKIVGVFDHHTLAAMPYTNVNDAVSALTGIYQQRRGGPIFVDGGRPEGNLYVIDGMRILLY